MSRYLLRAASLLTTPSQRLHIFMGRCPLFRNYFKSLGWCYSLYLLLLLQYGADRRSASVILLLFQYGAAHRIASLVLLLLQYGKARRNASLVLLLLQYGADHTALPI